MKGYHHGTSRGSRHEFASGVIVLELPPINRQKHPFRLAEALNLEIDSEAGDKDLNRWYRLKFD